MKPGKRIRVLIVDDSAFVRKILTEALSAEADLDVVGTAPDPYVARDKILALQPDVLTLDIQMPRMDGLTFLKKLMHYHPMPVIVISAPGEASCEAALAALRMGAIEVLAKPGGPYSVGELRLGLANKIRAAAVARWPRPGSSAREATTAVAPLRLPVVDLPNIVAIGASTGGTEAIEAVLARLPESCPGIVIVQHIPPVFSRAFAERLNQICLMEVKEAEDGEAVCPGRALLAPGNFHMLLRKTDGEYRVTVKDGPLVCYQRPSVDVLFASVAEAAGTQAVAVLLTGMGSDGAQGMLKMKQAGAATIAQDEASCVVFGMPKEAILLGAADQIIPLCGIPSALVAALQSRPTRP